MPISPQELPKMLFRKVVHKDLGVVSMDSSMMQLLMEISENRTLSEAADSIGLSLAELPEVAGRLMQYGLIEPLATQEDNLPRHFMAKMRLLLADAVGPMADLLIDKVLSDLSLTISEVPQKQADRAMGMIERVTASSVPPCGGASPSVL